MFDSLISTDVPDVIVNILRHWYSILRVNVRWGSTHVDARSFCTVFNGVRQGSVLSPVIFYVLLIFL